MQDLARRRPSHRPHPEDSKRHTEGIGAPRRTQGSISTCGAAPLQSVVM